VAPAAEGIASGIRQLRITDLEFRRFSALIHRETGIALGDHKRELVCARLGKRLRRYGYVTFGEYYEHLIDRDPDGHELLSMVNAITTNKTEFFRDEHHFAILRSTILAPPAAGRGAPRGLRIWSAGCSSGEEAYSIALTVLDALGHAGARDVRILASDINTEMLAKAQEGVYAVDQLARVPAALRAKYFVRSAGGSRGTVEVSPQVRELVAFRRINLIEGARIRTPMDGIFCRNVLIYFDRALQQRCVSRFAELLRPGGCLFLGGSESLLGLRPELRNLGNCVYRKVIE
jgi:chemotaxis protein methyltransferase CheR